MFCCYFCTMVAFARENNFMLHGTTPWWSTPLRWDKTCFHCFWVPPSRSACSKQCFLAIELLFFFSYAFAFCARVITFPITNIKKFVMILRWFFIIVCMCRIIVFFKINIHGESQCFIDCRLYIIQLIGCTNAHVRVIWHCLLVQQNIQPIH